MLSFFRSLKGTGEIMLERPDLEDAVIVSALKQWDGILVWRLDFLPIGNDSGAWVFRVTPEDAQKYFLKVRTLPVDAATLVVPHWLSAQGIRPVVSPIAARDGRLWRPVADFGLILYPYIEGTSGMRLGLTPQQWGDFGKTLKWIHSVQLPETIRRQVPVESFVPKWAEMVRRIQGRLASTAYRNHYEAELGEFWLGRSDEIVQITRRTVDLGAQLRQTRHELILCHADIHTANLLVDPQGDLHIVDWDQPVLAPKERDLMFVVDGSPDEALFFQGYGPVSIDRLALAYYRYEWVVQELGDYGERVFYRADLGPQTMEDSICGLRQLFDPGDVVDLARATEEFL
jgi:spectinomycin phosphotransferase